MKFSKNAIGTFLCICLSFIANAAIEHSICSVSGSSIVNSITTPNISVKDQYYPFAVSPFAWKVKGADNIVSLRYDDSKRILDNVSWSLDIQYTIKLYNSNGTIQNTFTNKHLIINYSPNTSYKDKDVFVYNGSYKAEVFVTNIDYTYNGVLTHSLPSTRNNDIFLDVEQKTERYYRLDYEDAYPTVVSSINTITNELEVSWSFLIGSESYDLEWLLIDVGDSPNTVDYDFDFTNSTRINTTNQHYKIPLAYPKGVLLFRVRGVGIDIDGIPTTYTKVESLWSVGQMINSGNTSSLSSSLNAYRLNWDGLEPGMNWQYSASYAEEGKRKEVISFFDGSLRNRQTATILNSDNNAVLSETKYDFEGRPALQLLPTPLENKGIRFYDNFNENYDKNSFDADLNYNSPLAINSPNQTGVYYSSSNTLATGKNSYVPDAEGYPYSRTLFKRDGTNRVVSQSGVGVNHKTGSNHETKYFYASPTQAEIDRLFGNEVGFVSHYKKNMILDPNGQVSINYLDQEGRIIATALAGNSPGNLMQLELIPEPVSITSDLLSGNNNTNGDYKISQSTIAVSTPGVFVFDYVLNSSDPFCAEAPCPSICNDCKYDLEIEIKDQSNTPIQLTIINNVSSCVVSNPTNNINCTNLSAGTYKFSANFSQIGIYTITKKIKIIYPDYGQLYTSFSSCITVPQVEPEPCLTCSNVCEQTLQITKVGENYYYLNPPNTPISNETAQSLAECISMCSGETPLLDECSLKYRILLADMSPGGQYFDNIFANSSTDINDWLNAKVSVTPPFNSWFASVFSYAGLDINNWNDVRANWNPTWSEILVQYHPEFCAYNYFCNSIICGQAENTFSMAGVNEYEELMLNDQSGNYFNPINLPYDIDHSSVANNDFINYNSTSSPTPNSYIDKYLYDKSCGDNNLSFCSPVVNLKRTDLIGEFLKKYIKLGTHMGSPVYASIYYLLDNPDDLNNKLNVNSLSNFQTATGITVEPATIIAIKGFHGDPTAPVGTQPYNGMFGGSSPLISKYDFFKNTYTFYRKMLIYKAIENYTTCAPNNNFISDTPTDLGFYTATVGAEQFRYQIRYPENDVFETILGTCPPFDPAALNTALNNLASNSNPDIIANCESNCQGNADYWISKIQSECPSLTQSQRDEIRTYLYEICNASCGISNPQGQDNVPEPGFSHSGFTHTGPYNTFSEVLSAYSCSSIIVHPLEDNSAGWCTCENFRTFIVGLGFDPESLSSADIINITNSLNSTYNPTIPYTTSNVQNWLSLCSVTPSTDVIVSTGGLSNMPIGLKCNPKNWALCTCENLTDYIISKGLGLTDYGNIVIALNNDYLPNTDYNAGQVQTWLTTCIAPDDEDMATAGALYNLPGSIKCIDPNASVPDNCTIENSQAQQDALYINNLYFANAIQNAIQDYYSDYRDACFSNSSEQFTVSYVLNEYYYTLYYYDQAGNLVKTVPPNGVHLLSSTSTPNFGEVANYRNGVSGATFKYPFHTLVTNYKYNSLQQLIEQTTPDAGITTFWYDAIGRLVVSQNANQADVTNLPLEYSYSVYDNLGRVFQVGEIASTVAMNPQTSNVQSSLNVWLSNGSRNQITGTIYDVALSPTVNGYFQGGQQNLRNRVASSFVYNDPNAPLIGLPSSTDGINSYYSATHYSYDIHGNVKTLIQENKALSGINSNLRYDLKQIDYDYDLVSGNVNKVYYQNQLTGDGKPQPDRFYHQYFYDSDNRLTEVLTSFDNVIWEKDAKYFYYSHGPLARTEIGDKQVQGTDYAYTIQGWIKGVNSNTLNSDRDIGKDAAVLMPGTAVKNTNANFASDAMGYTLGYFANDYKSVNTSITNFNKFEAIYVGGGLDAGSPGLFNGNIRHIVNTFLDINQDQVEVLGRTYKYDQLNRIRLAESYYDGSVTGSNYFTGAGLSNTHKEEFHYDLNGNILTVNRNGHLTGSLGMDQFTYHYWNNTNTGTYTLSGSSPLAPSNATNKLAFVNDNPALSANYGDDIENQINSDNYQYDNIGNLIKDKSEQIETITWNVYGKIKTIRRIAGSTLDELEFIYDASGNRICKIIKPRTGGSAQGQNSWKYTYYVRDASGNVLTTYSRKFQGNGINSYLDKFNLDEVHLYGSSRLGLYDNRDDGSPLITLPISSFTASLPAGGVFSNIVYTPASYSVTLNSYNRKLGNKYFELNNHLGNVVASISDRKLGIDDDAIPTTVEYYLPDIISSQDYYSFGAVMPGRGLPSSTGYRYGFGGQEKDDEVSGSGNSYTAEFWQYDTRLGRRWNTDPVLKLYESPYATFKNNPILNIDPLGDNADEFDKKGKKLSDLGGCDYDFTHNGNGDTEVLDKITGKTVYITGGESIIKNYTNRSSSTTWSDIYWEWEKGIGPAKSLFFGREGTKNGPFASLGKSSSLYSRKARKDLLNSLEIKGKSDLSSYSEYDPIRAGADGWQQMIGKANISWYKLGDDKVLFLIHDMKSMHSFFPLLPSWERGGFMGNKNGNTRQTYIWIETFDEVKRKNSEEMKRQRMDTNFLINLPINGLSW